jgi:hypothetical protein
MVKQTKNPIKKTASRKKSTASKKQSSSTMSHIDKFGTRVPLYTVTLGVVVLMLFATIATM